MVIIEASYPRSGGYPGRIFIGNDKCLHGLNKLVEVIHEGGAKACIEINTHRGMEDEVDPASAWEMMHPRKGTKVRGLSIVELKESEMASIEKPELVLEPRRRWYSEQQKRKRC
jgi:2,4-dienoyl-CoA reductase-like NADH-dependent reductase (Old Yellow Enzyme family)